MTGDPAVRHSTSSNRWIPRLIFAASALHLSLGVVTSFAHWTDVVSEGVWNTVADDDARRAALWFMLTGIALAGLGLLTRRHLIVTGRLPTEIGWILLVPGIPLALLNPASGGWLLIGIGVLALVMSRRNAAQEHPVQP
ncbi:hypothetical protein C8K30_10656 [Promicromonospora sp. AC04]|uniref:DUF6463 family protein n=1 Tax=Promicromonospora sp. AC04 TaxID=2135723 RepID=UPI000D364355|nr:DUF6463 family protein [Promicromonospora sp. AC04]PUB25969.1 hypothetical protein C8K30_10656 [Promicromonospora sp. AC04]